jgi:hypothetical protein
LYIILARVPNTLESLRDAFGEYTKSCGIALISRETQNDSISLVNELMALKEKHEMIISSSFNGDKKASKKLEEAFDHFINEGTAAAAAFGNSWISSRKLT